MLAELAAATLAFAVMTVSGLIVGSVMVAAVRTLFGNPTALPSGAAWPLAHPVPMALAWCGVILAVAVPAALWRFRARTTG